jgi:hypothetical protein
VITIIHHHNNSTRSHIVGSSNLDAGAAPVSVSVPPTISIMECVTTSPSQKNPEAEGENCGGGVEQYNSNQSSTGSVNSVTTSSTNNSSASNDKRVWGTMASVAAASNHQKAKDDAITLLEQQYDQAKHALDFFTTDNEATAKELVQVTQAAQVAHDQCQEQMQLLQSQLVVCTDHNF